MQKDNDKKTNL